jgi:predicted transposase YbfD/YdcC
MKQPPGQSRRPLPPGDQPLPSPSPDRVATSVDKAHGREEKRTLRTTTILTQHEKWPSLKQGFEIRRERRIQGKTTVEVVHGITSMTPERANAARLQEFTRDHWKIENELHYVRDVTLREDACRVRSGSGPQVLAALRNAVIHLLAGVEADSYPEAIEQMQIDPAKAMALIGIPQCE